MKAIGLGILAACAATFAALAGRRSSSPAGPSPAPLDAWATRADLATGCSSGPRPGVEAFRAWALQRGGRDGGIWRACEVGSTSEHHEGRAWDWMIDLGTGRGLVDELTANDGELARRAGVLYLIHDRRPPGSARAMPMIWRAYEPRGWASYGGPNPHTDHVHVSFSHAGAAGRTSFYTQGEGAAFMPPGVA